MERKTARISKEPEVRRQEILDTAMSVFMEKGYEAATMRVLRQPCMWCRDCVTGILSPSRCCMILQLSSM